MSTSDERHDHQVLLSESLFQCAPCAYEPAGDYPGPSEGLHGHKLKMAVKRLSLRISKAGEAEGSLHLVWIPYSKPHAPAPKSDSPSTS